MEVINGLDIELENTAVCIGKFDGIHKGHRTLVETAKKSGKKVVMLSVIFPGKMSIYSEAEQEYLAEKLGIDYYVRAVMNDEFLHLSPKAFVDRVLVTSLGAKLVCVGNDFLFGYQRQGDANYLLYAGRKYGFEVRILDKLKYGEEVISSTRIKKALVKGSINLVNELLGYPYFLMGKVVYGKKIGSKDLVPTINVYPDEKKELPINGVYASKILVDGVLYEGVCNIGVRPTVTDEKEVVKKNLEVNIFDFDRDIYGKKVNVFLYGFIREEKKFDTREELKKQIERDIKIAKNILVGY